MTADIAVYDPQSGGKPQSFCMNGSSAERLAMVLNEGELAQLSEGANAQERVANLADSPQVVVVKSGPHGAFVYEHGECMGRIPAYRSKKVYKIGSGDIFSAMFAYQWMENGASAIEAADYASRCVAYYVETRQPQMPASIPEYEALRPTNAPKKVYLAGSFFSTEHVWLIEEVRAALRSLGIPCFSPMHDVGISTAPHVVGADLAGLENCHVVLGLLSDNDPGTLFEIGYAHSKGIRVIAVTQNPGPQDLTMVSGSGGEIYDDLASAVYAAAWASME